MGENEKVAHDFNQIKIESKRNSSNTLQPPPPMHKNAQNVIYTNMSTGGIPLLPLVEDEETRNKTKGNNIFTTFQQSV
jgi:hypothetical protein